MLYLGYGSGLRRMCSGIKHHVFKCALAEFQAPQHQHGFTTSPTEIDKAYSGQTCPSSGLDRLGIDQYWKATKKKSEPNTGRWPTF